MYISPNFQSFKNGSKSNKRVSLKTQETQEILSKMGSDFFKIEEMTEKNEAEDDNSTIMDLDLQITWKHPV